MPCHALPQVRRPAITSFIEYDHECQQELLLLCEHLAPDTCLFGDISSFWRHELREIIDQLRRKPHISVQVLMPLIKERKAVSRKAWCQRHQRYCFCSTARSHTAGSSCTAFSHQGKQCGLNDSNVVHLLCWLALRKECQEPEITLENVEDFPTAILEEALGDCYTIEAVLMDPVAYGWPGQFAHVCHICAAGLSTTLIPLLKES